MPDRLTPRHHEVLALVAQGFSNQQIATELFIAHDTVKDHLRSILWRLGARTRAQAVAVAMREGWLR